MKDKQQHSVMEREANSLGLRCSPSAVLEVTSSSSWWSTVKSSRWCGASSGGSGVRRDVGRALRTGVVSVRRGLLSVLRLVQRQLVHVELVRHDEVNTDWWLVDVRLVSCECVDM